MSNKKSKKQIVQPNGFSKYLFENNIKLKSIEAGTGISYSALLRFKKRGSELHRRTISDVAKYLKLSAETVQKLIAE